MNRRSGLPPLTIGMLAGLVGHNVHPLGVRGIKWNLKPSPPRPEGGATEEQKNMTLRGHRGKGTRRQRKQRKS